MAIFPQTDGSSQDNPFEAIQDTFEKSLAGNYFFGLYLGNTNIGQTYLTIEDAEGERDGAVYYLETVARMALAGRHFYLEHSSYIDATFSAIAGHRYSEETNEDGSISTTVEQLEQEDGNWVFLRMLDDDMQEYSLPITEGNYPDLSGMFLLARKIPLDQKKTYRISWVYWPEDQTTDDYPRYRPLTIDVNNIPEAFNFRGEERTVFNIHMSQEGGEDYIFALDEDRNILAIWSEDIPVRYLAGTEEEATSDLPATVTEVTGGSGPAETVQIYFEVLAKIREPDDLDIILDWDSVHAEMSADNEAVAAMSPEMVASLFKNQLENKGPAISGDMVDLLMGVVETTVDGDSATVAMPGEDDLFKLRKIESGWIIMHFPH
jgi:hypothetical protein